MEYLVVVYEENNNKVLLSLRQAEILNALAADQELVKQGGCVPGLQDAVAPKSELVHCDVQPFPD